MNRKAIILGIKGYKLTNSEKLLFKKAKPWGIILFSRNIQDITQLKNLTSDIRKLFKDNKYPIIIDQEGGKVSRLNKILDLSFFSQYFFGQLYKKKKKLFKHYYKIYINTVCNILKSTGININTVPVLDVRRNESHDFFENRSFSKSPQIVSKLGKLCIDFYEQNKIATVIKHLPGLGVSKHDSHFKTPIININKQELIKSDFKPFKSCNSHFAMTAHAIYSSIDPYNTATHSNIVISTIIRKHMKFRGILMSDDISMKSLVYSLEINALRALEAGCDLVLHCSGNIIEMTKLLKVIPIIDKNMQKKTSQFYKFLG